MKVRLGLVLALLSWPAFVIDAETAGPRPAARPTPGVSLAGAPVAFLELNPVADTALRSTTPNNNFGAAVDLPVGVAIPGSPRNRVLLKFSLEELPADAIILSATLRLTVVVTGTPAANFGLHRALQDWGEGTKTTIINGGPATQDEATWNNRFHPATAWASGGGQPGVDYVEAPSAVGSLGATGSTGLFTSEQMVDDLQLWRDDPGANFGWFLIALDEPAGTGKRIGSRENAAPDARPLLTIEFTGEQPAEPPTLFDPGVVNGEFRFSFQAEANRSYAVEFLESWSMRDWNVLTTIPEQPSGAVMHVTNSISSSSGFFRVRTP